VLALSDFRARGCQCQEITIIPHAHGTHVESQAHTDGIAVDFPMRINAPLLAKVVTFVHDNLSALDADVQFLVFKKKSPRMKGFAGLDPDLVEAIRSVYPAVFILGIDEPSFDPEHDGGELKFHRRWFQNSGSFLVELLDLTNISDSNNYYHYCLMNAVLWAGTDAIPASPILYPISRSQAQ